MPSPETMERAYPICGESMANDLRCPHKLIYSCDPQFSEVVSANIPSGIGGMWGCPDHGAVCSGNDMAHWMASEEGQAVHA